MAWNAAEYYAQNRARIRASQAAYYRGLTKKAKRENNARMSANYHKRREREPWENLLGKARSRAREKKLPCDLTRDWLKERWTGKCELTGMPFDLASGTPGPMSASIDRIVPALGYVKGNCRLVLFCVNAFKGQMTDKQMKDVARRIACLKK